jgi:GLPGLI family protein
MKMNKHTIILLLFYFNINAQSIIVQYSENSIFSPESLQKIPEISREKMLKSKIFTLSYSNDLSIYKADDIGENVNTKTETFKTIIKKSEKLYFKNFQQKEMLFVWPNGQENLHGKDSLQNWNWEITDETKIIEGFKCKKAISNWHNFESIAWFAEDINTSIGPDKYDGLPGLILNVYTQYFEWKAIKINQNNNQIIIEAPSFNDEKTYTINEINDIFNKKVKNNETTKSTIQIGNETITTEKIMIKLN